MKTLTLVLTLLILGGNAWAESKPDFNLLADSILQAENNSNYGVLTKYKTTTPRQACINTINNSYKRWSVSRKLMNKYPDFIDYLGSTYCPIGASNDPDKLNRHWTANVKYWYRQFEGQSKHAI